MQNTYKVTLRLGIILLVMVALVLLVKPIFLGSYHPVRLTSAPPLAGVISQALITGGDTTATPIEGKDFKLENTTYFNDKTWVVTSIVPLGNQANSSVAILQKQGGSYVVVLGPGSIFPSSEVSTLPSDVAQYLNNNGMVYDATSD